MREANITNVKIGDKVEYKDRLAMYHKNREGIVYGKITSIKSIRHPHPIVKWINYKGRVVDMDYCYCNLYVGYSNFYFYEQS